MKKIILASLIVSQLILAPVASAQVTNDVFVRAQLLQQISLLLEQIKSLQTQLAVQQNAHATLNSLVLSSNATIDSRYRVLTTDNFAGIQNEGRRQLVERFFKLLPEDFDNRFTEVVFFTDTQSDIDAFVETAPGMTGWRVGFENTLASYGVYSEETTELLVHEIAHVIAYEKVGNKTLLELFEEEFWENASYRNQYVSEYARENATEDFSESFMYFVYDANYNGIAKEKVQFFEQFELTRNYRSEIRSNI